MKINPVVKDGKERLMNMKKQVLRLGTSLILGIGIGVGVGAAVSNTDFSVTLKGGSINLTGESHREYAIPCKSGLG